MLNDSSRSPRGPIHTLIAALRRAEVSLVLAFAVAVLLVSAGAYAVWRGGVRHRATADEALRDQASYISGMIATSAYNQGWFAVRTLLHAWEETLADGKSWPDQDSIRARATREALAPGDPLLATTRFFTGDDDSWHATDGSTNPENPVHSAIVRRFADSLPPNGQFRIVAIPLGEDTTLAFVAATPRSPAGEKWHGVEVPLVEFRRMILLPRVKSLANSFRYLRDSLMKSQQLQDSMPPLAIRVETLDHVPLFATTVAPHAPWIGTRSLMGSLQLAITVSIEPAAVPILMPGGYPGEPGTGVLIALGAGLVLLTGASSLVWRTVALSRQREEFTSSISHELRTPLTNIQLFAETLLLDRARTSAERHSALETITRETRRLVHMVENVLALSRVGRPAMNLVRRPEQMDRMVHDILASFEPILQARDITVDLTLEGPSAVLVDGDAVRRILVNLLDNAVRYGPSGQTIRITAAHRGEDLEILVEDEGPGVPHSQREKIWRPFERGTAGANGGTGIGLAVVQQLVTLHGGLARVEGGKRGARFIVVLPTPNGTNGGAP